MSIADHRDPRGEQTGEGPGLHEAWQTDPNHTALPARTRMVSRNPRDGQTTAVIESTGPAQLDAECIAAGAAFLELQHTTTYTPTQLLSALARGMDSHREQLIDIADAETALGHARLGSELDRATYQLREFATVADSAALLEPITDSADPARIPPRADQRRVNVPLGPVAVFAASNFPFAFGVLGGDTASALAAGCTVVVKAHPAQPRTGAVLAAIAADAARYAGAPQGALCVVAGDSPQLGIALTSHPAIQAVSFTGSHAAGKALMHAAAQRAQPIPVYAEMGSINPVFIGPAAAARRPQEIARGWAAALTSSAGQLCTKPGILVSPSGAYTDRIVEAAAAQLDAQEPSPMLTAEIRMGFRNALTRAGQIPGVQWVREPQEQPRPGTWQDAGLLMVSSATVLDQPALFEEIFGPAGIIIDCGTPDEAQRIAQAMPGSLTATLYADPEDDTWAAALLPTLRTRVGRLLYNTWPTGVSVGWATVHGGPWPATSAPQATSVGITSARRFLRPIAYQGFPVKLLPPVLRANDAVGRGSHEEVG